MTAPLVFLGRRLQPPSCHWHLADGRFGDHNDRVLVRLRVLLAVAWSALTVAGCNAASTEGKKAEDPAAAGSSMSVAAESDTKADGAPVSEAQQKEAQRLAEEAEKIMLDPALAPKNKYPKALGMFRDVLEIDPNNALAKDSIKLIEDIYASMGRPVPKPA